MSSTAATADTAAARRSLEGLALGDAFGERWFPLFREPRQAYNEVRARRTPPEPVWHWTDDTALALALHQVLDECGHVEQDRLALLYARAFDADQARGYGHGMHMLLPRLLTSPADWRTLAPGLFEGGSLGNGAAMRVAPLGARFHEDVGHAAEQAALSAAVTHAHPEGIAGAVAVAVAAALSVRGEFTLEAVAGRTPEGLVRDGLLRAADVPSATEPWQAADLLGNGQRIRADDTVPFALWTAARHPGRPGSGALGDGRRLRRCRYDLCDHGGRGGGVHRDRRGARAVAGASRAVGLSPILPTGRRYPDARKPVRPGGVT